MHKKDFMAYGGKSEKGLDFGDSQSRRETIWKEEYIVVGGLKGTLKKKLR